MRKSARSRPLWSVSAAVVAASIPYGLQAQEANVETTLPPVVVEAPSAPKKKVAKKQKPVSPAPMAPATAEPDELPEPLARLNSVANQSFARVSEVTPQQGLGSNDSAQLFQNFAGMSFQTGGGVSSLPYLNGFGDDRLKVVVNGMTLTSSCGNHMNPAFSYIDASAAGSVSVIAGITPVSRGGDSLGGTLSVDSPALPFASASESFISGGRLSTFYRSNGDGFGGSVHAYAATKDASIAYTGSTVKADQYKDGSGRVVDSTQYKATNHLLQAAGRSGNDRFGIDFGWQSIPYQGFVNQVMDMTDNKSLSVNAYYKGQFDWGFAEARIYRQAIRHKMDLLEEKMSVFMMGMPMDTRGSDTGYELKAGAYIAENSLLRVGHEYHRYRLDDWWPPLAGMDPWMGPSTYWNINNGKRDRAAVYAELEQQWSSAWTTLVGVRLDHVVSDTGDVVGYSPMYDADANTFNALDHKRKDTNVDVTATARYVPDATQAYDFGVARKTRSPNLYERYTWSNSVMAGTMINWFGDLNAYKGNIGLDPETAYSLRASAAWHDAGHRDWHVKVSGYLSYVDDYIGVELNPDREGLPSDRTFLQFVNHDAQLGGVDIEAMKALGHWWGDWSVGGTFSYVAGRDLDNDTYLFNLMPVNARFALTHALGNWTNVAEVQAVAAKDRVDEVRGEARTGAFALLNLRTSYAVSGFRFDAGIENVFDTDYELPLGGYSAALYGLNGGMVDGAEVHGLGRSFNVGLSVDF